MTRKLSHGLSEQARAWQQRLDDARALLERGRSRGAMYLAGYAVEIILKVRLMRMHRCLNLEQLDDVLLERGSLPDRSSIYTHSLESLLRLTGARDRMQSDLAAWRSFQQVNRWTPAWRYSAVSPGPEAAGDFVQAVEAVTRWIDHSI